MGTRDALLDAARERFAAEGYAGTSIRALARDVGIKESSVYHHFDGKQAILDGVLARADERLAAVAARFGVELADPTRAAEGYVAMPLHRLEEVCQGFLTVWLRDPDVVTARRILTLEQYRSPTAAQRLRAFTVEAPLAFQTQLFADLIERGEFFPADPAAVALAFWGPVLAILSGAEADGGEPVARARLAAHLTHFRQTHIASEGAR